MTPWKWSDLDRELGRWAIFMRSAEFLTTIFLWGYAMVLLWPGSTLSRFPAFTWLISIADDQLWAIIAFALSIVAPLAVWLQDGRLRLMSLFSQAVFFIFLGLSALFNSPTGLGWITFLGSGGWLLWRSIDFAWPHMTATFAEVARTKRRVERRG